MFSIILIVFVLDLGLQNVCFVSTRCAVELLVVADGNIDTRFRIDRLTGQMSCDPLDRERQATYNLTIEARDSGQPQRRSEMMLYIEVSSVAASCSLRHLCSGYICVQFDMRRMR